MGRVGGGNGYREGRCIDYWGRGSGGGVVAARKQQQGGGKLKNYEKREHSKRKGEKRPVVISSNCRTMEFNHYLMNQN